MNKKALDTFECGGRNIFMGYLYLEGEKDNIVLPDNLTVKGDLELVNWDVSSLPKGLIIENSFVLRGQADNTKFLPDDMMVNEEVRLFDTCIERLPAGINHLQSLYVRNSPLECLPENLTIDRELILENVKVTQLPDNIVLNGAVTLSGVPIRRLPEALKIGRYLRVEDCPLESLPSGLVVEEGAYFRDVLLTEIPKGVTFGGDLDIKGTNICRLSKGLVVGGSLDIAETNISELPEDISIGWSLIAYNTKLTALPELKKIWDLNIRDTSISELPDNIVVLDDLNINNTRITKLPENSLICDSIYADNQNLEELPINTIIGGSLYFNSVAREFKMEDLKVCGYVGVGNPAKILASPTNYKNAKIYMNELGTFIYVDFMFLEVIHRHNDIFKVRYVDGKYSFYLVADEASNWAHGGTLHEAMEDLQFKGSSRSVGDYKEMKLDDILSKKDAVICYRTITGACRFGTNAFLRKRLKVGKADYSIREIMELTEGEYGHEAFVSFFTND